MLTSFFVLIPLAFFIEFLFLFPFSSSCRIHIRLRGVNENFSYKSPRITRLSHSFAQGTAFPSCIGVFWYDRKRNSIIIRGGLSAHLFLSSNPLGFLSNFFFLFLFYVAFKLIKSSISHKQRNRFGVSRFLFRFYVV